MMRDWLAERAQVTPQKLALLIAGRRWTYGELETAVYTVAGFLHHKGIGAGDFVAVLLPNSFEYVCLIHALARLGAVLVPLNTRLTSPELAWQLAHVAAKWLITDRPQTVVAQCERIIVNGDWLEKMTPSPISHSPFALHKLQAVVFTSGTSGQPKGAMLTFANHFYSAMASAYRLGVQPDDLWLSVLPLYHVGGLAVIFRSCLYGTAVSLHTRFDLNAINHDLDSNPITLISLVPTMLHRLLETRTHWPAALRLILLGGAAAPPELVERANALPGSAAKQSTDSRPPLVATTYGLTEASSQVATMLPADAARKPGSVGKPLLFTTITVVDEQGNELPSGAYGEIVVSGPTVMAGYFNSETGVEIGVGQHSISNFHTGDIGYLDA
ncbi:MAG: AMP-binding protein, partial [Chloroflexota bacterium]